MTRFGSGSSPNSVPAVWTSPPFSTLSATAHIRAGSSWNRTQLGKHRLKVRFSTGSTCGTHLAYRRHMNLDADHIEALVETAREARRLIVETIFRAQAGHLGGPLSAADILV